MAAIRTKKRFDFADFFILSFLFLMAFVTIYPFYNVLILSFADQSATIKNPVYILPTTFEWTAYRIIFVDDGIVSGFKVSLFNSIAGTLASMVVTTAGAYALSRKYLPARNLIMKYLIFTMYFSGGLVPYYLLVKALHLRNHLLVYILPQAVVVFYLIMMKNFFENIPDSIEESAKIDGANDIYILWKIIIPISGPILATIGLFFSVDKWNDWWTALIFINKSELYSLQLVLRNIILTSSSLTSNIRAVEIMNENNPMHPQAIRMAAVVVTTIPILLVYPFMQRYFTKGIMLGSVKS